MITQGEPIERLGEDLPRRWHLSRALKEGGGENLLPTYMLQNVSGRGNSKCKGLGVELYLCSRKSKEASTARGE